MRVDVYQRDVERTLKSDHDPAMKRPAVTPGLCGEAGEVGELVKKQYLHGREMDYARLAEELGDTLWYVSAVASSYGLDLGDIAAGNVAKLRARYPDGFAPRAEGGVS